MEIAAWNRINEQDKQTNRPRPLISICTNGSATILEADMDVIVAFGNAVEPIILCRYNLCGAPYI